MFLFLDGKVFSLTAVDTLFKSLREVKILNSVFTQQ